MGRVGKRAAITQVDENAILTRVHVARSSGLVTYLPTYERLKAFHSRLYFRPVNRVPLLLSYVRNSRGSVACEAKRLVLSSFFSSLPLSLSLEKAPDFSNIHDELLRVCKHSKLGIFVNISRANVMTAAGKQLRYLGSITSTSVSFNRS